MVDVTGFFDTDTGTVSYVVADRPSGRAAVIDSVLSFDPKSGRTGTAGADTVVAFVTEQRLTVDWLLETHVHADHLSALPYLKRRLGGVTGIGGQLPCVQQAFKDIFNVERDFHLDGRQFDHLFLDDETFQIGAVPARVIYTPGHTPACISYLIGDAVFVGDTVFMPDSGTARCDFPGGDARTLYRSVQRLYGLPAVTRMFICHDYRPGGRPAAFETTVAEQRASNVHIRDGVTEDAFVALRTARDRTLSMPVLILPSVQVNIRAGEMPPAEDNGVTYLKIPVNRM